MCLRYSDIENIKNVEHDCYLTHPKRNEDTDDMVLDAANRSDMKRKDLLAWLKSKRSWRMMEEHDDESEMDESDFIREFNPIYG